jgi:tRNA(fMet)-specific endonuclease VapC
MDETLLDSDILSEILKAKNRQVLDTANRYLALHSRFAFSAITFYEITRGFRLTGAVRGLSKFLKLADDSDVLPISIPVLQRAADLWADAYRGGHPRGDADLIIAATALESKRTLGTGNTAHFTWISGLTVIDWRSGSP